MFVVKDETGKIRKPPSWRGPDLSAAHAAAAVFRAGKAAQHV